MVSRYFHSTEDTFTLNRKSPHALPAQWSWWHAATLLLACRRTAHAVDGVAVDGVAVDGLAIDGYCCIVGETGTPLFRTPLLFRSSVGD